MCIILTCDPNVRPSFDLLDTCFDNNPDGAGIMWCEHGTVQTSKGYTTASDLFSMIECVPSDSPLCIHMRIATSGGIDVGTCHPFPVCDDLDILHASDTECRLALMHNGVIPDEPTDTLLGISDTVSFTMHTVTELHKRYGLSKAFRRHMRAMAPHNRFALLSADGTITRIGAGWETIQNGMHASNSSWTYRRNVMTWNASSWDYYDTEEYETEVYEHWDDIIERYCYGCSYMTHCLVHGPECFAADDIADDTEPLFTMDDMEP